jgi:hypothetical protein
MSRLKVKYIPPQKVKNEPCDGEREHAFIFTTADQILTTVHDTAQESVMNVFGSFYSMVWLIKQQSVLRG